MDLLGDIGLTDIGAGTVVIIFVLFLATGRLVTRKTHLDRVLDLKEQRDEAYRQRDDWKRASELDSRSLATALAQQDRTLEGAKLAEAIAKALFQVTGGLNVPPQETQAHHER